MVAINGTAGPDILIGTALQDSIFGLAGNDILRGEAGSDSLSGAAGSDILRGGRGNDTLNGGTGDDILFGSFSGVGEQDSFTGGTGRDRFVLGTATQVLYDDGKTTTAGRGDYALITDFSTSQDVIQLKGQKSNYRLAASPNGLPTGTAIYRNKPGSQPDELIGIIQNRTGLSLNSNYLRFVGTPSLNLSQLDGSNGFVLKGVDERDFSGRSVSTAGDINGDGFDDLIIGAPKADANGQDRAGESYVVFGQAEGFDASLNPAELDGNNGFVINGTDPYNYSGRSVSTAGDINGDGFDDLIIGAFGADANGQFYAGESYVVFGQAESFGASLNLSQLDGSNGFVLNGIDEDDRSGISVSTAGDINGDGFDDLLIGAFFADPNDQTRAGESYVVFGQAQGFGASLNLSQLDGSNGFVLNGIDQNDVSGYSVSTAGDVDGDGFDDLLIGAFGADANGQEVAGESYVLFGRDFTGQVTHAGTAGNDLLTGTSGGDILVGGLGNDKLNGGLGIDVLKGGGGNDFLSFGATDRRLDGGSGQDTLRVEGSGVELDLRQISNNKITEFEIIDITGTGNNSLRFSRLDVLDLSDTTNRLIVNGNAGDVVTSRGQGWTLSGTTTLDGIDYNRYVVGQARLLVDTDIVSQVIS